MSIVYAVVAADKVILAEHAEGQGNFEMVTQSIIDKIPNKNDKCTYVYDNYLFHYIQEDGITYLCMTDEEFSRRTAFAFLQQLAKAFVPYKSRARNQHAFAFQSELSKTIKSSMAQFSQAAADDPLVKARSEANAVRDIMVRNIDRVLERDERVNILVERAEELEDEAGRFRRKAGRLKRQMWCESQKWTLMIFAVVVVIIIIIVLAAVQPGKKNKGKHHKKSTTTTTTTTTTTPKQPEDLLEVAVTTLATMVGNAVNSGSNGN